MGNWRGREWKRRGEESDGDNRGERMIEVGEGWTAGCEFCLCFYGCVMVLWMIGNDGTASDRSWALGIGGLGMGMGEHDEALEIENEI